MAAVGRLRRFDQITEETPTKVWAYFNETIFVRVNTSLRGVVTGLKPWTTYELAVAGYNSVGRGNLAIQRVTTLDSSK